MSRRAKIQVAVLIVALVWQARLSACSMVTLSPIEQEWESHAAIMGVVLEHLSDSTILPTGAPVPGLVIEIQEHLGGRGGGPTAQVFLLRVDPSCSAIPFDVEALGVQYPVGTVVTVVGEVRKVDPSLVLVSSTEDFGHVAKVQKNAQRLARGDLDFSAMKEQYEEHPAGSFSLELAWRNAHRSWFEDFEYLRALGLLAEAGRSEKVLITENLINYVGWRRVFDEIALARFKKLLRVYSVPRRSRGELIDRFRTLIM